MRPTRMKIFMLQTWNTWLFGFCVGNLGSFSKGSFIKMTPIWCLTWRKSSSLKICARSLGKESTLHLWTNGSILQIGPKIFQEIDMGHKHSWLKSRSGLEPLRMKEIKTCQRARNFPVQPWSFSFYRGDWVLIPFRCKGVSLSTFWTCEIRAWSLPVILAAWHSMEVRVLTLLRW